MQIVSIVGARPQFIKVGPVSRKLRKHARETLVHTGQHYDRNMSELFFDELQIPKPDHNLNVGSGQHGQQTAAMLEGIEQILLAEPPDAVLVYGDTNSTLAGALAAAKLHIPIVHVEAGLRSYNRRMPEEINRVLTDQLSALLLCPSKTAVDCLTKEGIRNGVHIVGDVMHDALNHAAERGQERCPYQTHGLSSGEYALATVHRAENTDDPVCLKGIVDALSQTQEQVLWPVHPRTRKRLDEYGMDTSASNLMLIDPVGYLDMVQLIKHAKTLLTDSGGMQKEAYWLKTPCITLRTETEWVETVETGWNVLTGTDTAAILDATRRTWPNDHPPLYGDGKAAGKIVDLIMGELQ